MSSARMPHLDGVTLRSVRIHQYHAIQTIAAVICCVRAPNSIDQGIIVADNCSQDGTHEVHGNETKALLDGVVYLEANDGKPVVLHIGIKVAHGRIGLIHDTGFD